MHVRASYSSRGGAQVSIPWLYDVWVKLYGREFADAEVAVESKRGRMYPAAWDFALSFTPERARGQVEEDRG